MRADAYAGHRKFNPYNWNYYFEDDPGKAPADQKADFHIAKLRVTLNGDPISKLGGEMTSRDCMGEFVR